jgi:hypothetical protein
VGSKLRRSSGTLAKGSGFGDCSISRVAGDLVKVMRDENNTGRVSFLDWMTGFEPPPSSSKRVHQKGVFAKRARAGALTPARTTSNRKIRCYPNLGTSIPPRGIARLDADDGKGAVSRVCAALESEPFTVEDDARKEPGI